MYDFQGELEVLECGCNSWLCPKCAKRYWSRVFNRVAPHLAMFKKPDLLTMTVDRSKFGTPERAYDYLQKENGFIRRFLRLFGFKKAMVVIEFHNEISKKNGRVDPDAVNWPHVHVLVDKADVGNFMDFARGWKLWRDKWGIGRWDGGSKKRKRAIRDMKNNSVKVAGYILNYLKKPAKAPEWIKKRQRSIRPYRLYGELREAVRCDTRARKIDRLGFDDENDVYCENTEKGYKKNVKTTIGERLAGCCGKCVVVEHKENGGYRFVGVVNQCIGYISALGHCMDCGDLRIYSKSLPIRDDGTEWRRFLFLDVGKMTQKEGVEELNRIIDYGRGMVA